MQKQFSIAEAKNRLPTLVHYVEKGPSVKLTRWGKPVAVLLSIEEYEILQYKLLNKIFSDKEIYNVYHPFEAPLQDIFTELKSLLK